MLEVSDDTAVSEVTMEMPGLTIEVVRDEDEVIMALSGYIDGNTHAHLEDMLRKELESKPIMVEIDMKNVSYMSSKGVEIFIDLWVRAEGESAAENPDEGREILVSGCSEQVGEVFEILGLPIEEGTFSI